MQLLNEKLDVLIKKYTAMKTENKQLKEAISQQLESIEALNNKLSILEEQMLSVQIGKTVSTDVEKASMKRQLDMVIAAIDKILVSLNG